MQLAFGKQSLHILVCVVFNSLLARKIDQSAIFDDSYSMHLTSFLPPPSLSLSSAPCVNIIIHDGAETFWDKDPRQTTVYENNIHLKSIEKITPFHTTKALH